MTSVEVAQSIQGTIEGMAEEEARVVIAKQLELAWMKGWEVARCQMVAAGQQFELALKDQSFLSLTGPKSATQGVHAFTDGIKGADRPEVVL